MLAHGVFSHPQPCVQVPTPQLHTHILFYSTPASVLQHLFNQLLQPNSPIQTITTMHYFNSYSQVYTHHTSNFHFLSFYTPPSIISRNEKNRSKLVILQRFSALCYIFRKWEHFQITKFIGVYMAGGQALPSSNFFPYKSS